MSLSLLLEAELMEAVHREFEVYAMSAPGPEIPELQRLGIEHVAIPSFRRSWTPSDDIKAAFQVWKALSAIRPDILHTHTPKAGVIGRMVGRALRIPVIVNTCHGLWATETDSVIKRSGVLLAEAVAASCSDLELFVNTEDSVRMRHFISDRRRRVVFDGVDTKRFVPSEEGRRATRLKLGIPEDVVLVGGVGRLVREKGVGEFMAAARALRGSAEFIWIGPADPERPDWIELDPTCVRGLGLRADMAALYQALDIFVLPSYREGLPRVAMEAAASGCCMVLTDIRGSRELSDPAGVVTFIPARDSLSLIEALRSLIDDRERRQNMGRRARLLALSNFDQANSIARSFAAYDDVIRRKQT